MGEVIPIEKIRENIEEFRKKECFCDEIDDGDVCSKCGQMLPSKPKKCYICQICDSILSKFSGGYSK